MAKEIIALTQQSNGTTLNLAVAFWYAITSGARVQTGGSQWSGASTAENTAIQNGTILEELESFSYPLSLSAANIKAQLQQVWTNRNAQLAGQGPNQFNGVFFDSVTGWSA